MTMRPRAPSAMLACMTSMLITACGGGGSSDSAAPAPSPTPVPSPSPGPAPDPAAAFKRTSPDREAYWAQGTGVRPNLLHLLGGGTGGSTVVSLSAGETAWVRARAAAAGSEGAGALLAKTGGEVRAQAVAVQTRLVTGLYSFIFHNAAAGTEHHLQDLTTTTVEAIAPNSAGGFDVIAALPGGVPGRYVIEVPEGPYWARLGTRYVWTDQAFVDWSFDFFGRSTVVSPALPTRFVVNAGNLAPWQTNDALAWVVPQHGYSLAMPLADLSTINAPRLGEAALGAFGFELGPNGLADGLLDSTKGDFAYINQLATLPAVQSYGPVRVLARSMVLPPLTTADGSTTPVNSGFLGIAANAKLKLRWQRASFVRYGDAVHPGALPSTSFLGVSSFALPPLYGTPSDASSLLEFSTLGSTDIDFGTLRYGNPFPPDWNRTIDAFVGFTKSYLAPGATVSEPLERGVSMSVLIDLAAQDDANVTLLPAVTPPRHPQINGKTLFANQLGVGTTPLLSWTAPEVGVAQRYFLRILELLPDGTRSRLRRVATLTTAETKVTLPPGLLSPGHQYVITIAAMSTSSPVTQPNRSSLPFAFATTMSAIVSP